MVIDKKKIMPGRYVVIALKDNPNKIVKGIVMKIIKEMPQGTLVELVDGSIGFVKGLVIVKPSLKAVREVRNRFNLQDKPKLLIKPVSKEVVREILEKEDIFSGESKDIEYKTSALWSQDLSKNELDSRNTFETKQYGNRASKVILAKAIAAFLNTNGGSVVIGIKEQKEIGKANEIVGIEGEFKKLRNKDYREDGYRRMIIDEVIKPYFPETIFNHFNDYLSISFPKKDGKTLCKISVKKSDHEVFITIDNKDHFFIKVDAETRELYGKKIIDYVKKVWK